MIIWKNTDTLTGYDSGLQFSENRQDADLVLMGSKPIDVGDYSNLKGIFRAGLGRDNVPEKDAAEKGISVRYPSPETINIIYEETARFTCFLISRMLYSDIGTIDPWIKKDRLQLKNKTLLIIGTGNIGSKVAKIMQHFLQVTTFDIMKNSLEELSALLHYADCVSIHIPKTEENINFMDKYKLSLLKDNAVLVNTARGAIVSEDALYSELKTGRLRAAFDVFWEEPYQGKLTEFAGDRFFMTPHVASTCTGFLEGCRKDLDDFIKELNNA